MMSNEAMMEAYYNAADYMDPADYDEAMNAHMDEEAFDKFMCDMEADWKACEGL